MEGERTDGVSAVGGRLKDASGKIRENKQAKAESKADKLKAKEELNAAKALVARRQKAIEARPVPKLGRRKSRTKF